MRKIHILTGLTLALAFSQIHAQSWTAQPTASMFHYQGAWNAGTQVTEMVPISYLGVSKNNVLSLGLREDIVPNVFNGYIGMANFQPDLTKLIAKTPFDPSQLSLSFDLGGGISKFPDSSTKPMIEGRLNVNYALTAGDSLTGGYAGGGFIGRDRYYFLSVGWAHTFGVENVPSAMVKKLIHRAQVRKAAERMAR